MSSLLCVQSLSHAYGDLLVYENLNLEVQKGEWLALLGESGCGKSTLLRSVAGLITPTAGKILLDGNDITLTPPHRRGVGLVFQDYALFPNLTVQENIEFGMQPSPSTERTKELLQLIGLSGLHNRYPAQLSGGQQQRVALARTLAIRPKLLLLDEPFANIDAARKESLGLELRTLLKGCSVILVTHDRSDAMALADKIAILEDRKIAQLDSPEVIYTKPKNQTIAELSGPTNIISGSATGVQVQTKIGTFSLIEPRQGSVEILIRPDDVQLQNDEHGVLKIVHQHYVGGAFRIYATGLDQNWIFNAPRRLDTKSLVSISAKQAVWAFPNQ